ncbi:MAG: hypothetical protein MJZ86_00175 [Bacteroidales bacterium]|nr:hypothetical protein [Bacteroidales bacterium]
MKKNFRLAAIALTACAMMVACNNNAPEEAVLDTMPVIDTTVVDSVVTDTVVEEAPVVEAAPAKKTATNKKQKTKVEEVKEGIQTVKAATLQAKKDVSEVTDELKKAGEGSMQTKQTSANPLGAGKKSASDVFGKK